MSDFGQFSMAIPESAPLFPLPDCVLFPGVVLPLHVFERRYRQLIAHCIEHDAPFVLCTLQPGYKELYDTKEAPIYPLGCLVKITIQKELDDGRYMLIVRGVSRVEILHEQPSDEPYRTGLLLSRPDDYPDPPQVSRQRQREELLKIFFSKFPELKENPSLTSLLGNELSFGNLSDLLAYSSRTSPRKLYEVLACQNVDARSTLVLKLLFSQQQAPLGVQEDLQQSTNLAKPFPPPFSMN